MGAIIKRELSSYFHSAIAYVAMAVFFLFSGIFFQSMLIFDNSNLQLIVLQPMFTIIIFILPILTMKLFSEEKRQKTDQALLTAPINIGKVVLGKFISAEILYLCCMAIYIPMTIVVACFTTPAWSMIICSLIGMFLFGSSIIAIGIFISSITESQIIAAVAGIAAGVFISMLDNIATTINIDFIKTAIQSVSFMSRYNKFYSGLLNTSDIVFFISIVVLFLFFTTRVIDRKRWS